MKALTCDFNDLTGANRAGELPGFAKQRAQFFNAVPYSAIITAPMPISADSADIADPYQQWHDLEPAPTGTRNSAPFFSRSQPCA